MAKQTPYTGYGAVVFMICMILFDHFPFLLRLAASFAAMMAVVGIGKLMNRQSSSPGGLHVRERDDSTGM
jgi:hypothetical protein